MKCANPSRLQLLINPTEFMAWKGGHRYASGSNASFSRIASETEDLAHELETTPLSETAFQILTLLAATIIEYESEEQTL